MPAAVFHFSEDPSILEFRPHRPVGREEEPAQVWAIDEEHAPLYWFPRECPRVTFWPAGGARHERVHAIEWAWLDRVRSTRLYVYRLDGTTFRPAPGGGGWISDEVLRPLDVQPVGGLLERHAEAGIELRLVANLWPLHHWAVASGLEFSSVRLRNAAPDPGQWASGSSAS
jgi:hypothetical protein